MKAGIIAAGEGSRFVQAGIGVPKPLIEVGGVSLLGRTLSTLEAGGIDEVALIVNEQIAQDVAQHLEQHAPALPLRTLVKTTESSMHSLFELSALLGEERFVLCTVDSIIPTAEAVGFIEAFRDHPDTEMLLSYTDFVDDEKPLRIAVAPDGRVTALGPEAEAAPYCTIGLYGMAPSVLPLLRQTVERGMRKLRNFLGFALHSGAEVRGHRISKAIDVDRPADLRVAEAFLRQHQVTPCG